MAFSHPLTLGRGPVELGGVVLDAVPHPGVFMSVLLGLKLSGRGGSQLADADLRPEDTWVRNCMENNISKHHTSSFEGEEMRNATLGGQTPH